MDQLCAFIRTLRSDRGKLNTLCFTLEEIRVQYTKADNVAWILILSCIYNLKQIGWPGKWYIYIYIRLNAITPVNTKIIIY